jgi:uncharacterized protein YdhG (YjbR/CyaY superfamily)
LNSSVAKHATVDEYIAAIPEPLREVAARAREVVDAELEGATSAIKWAHPTWSIGKAPICLFADWLRQARELELA